MKDFKLLKILDRLAPLFTRFGLDYRAMRSILQVKLTMDQRRVPTILTDRKNAAEKDAFKASLLMYGLMGLLAAVFLFLPIPLFYKMNFVLGLIMFMVMTTMISDFSTVLLDVKDKAVLLPRPVSFQTLNAAKIIHIGYYLFLITMATAGPSLLAGLVKYGVLFGLIFLPELILICGLVVFFTAVLYFAVLSFFDGEKLKDIINYFQILLSVFLLVGFQLLARVFDFSGLAVNFQPAAWHYLIPTAWFAAPFNLFLEHDFSRFYTVLSLLVLIIPVLTTGLYIRWINPYFERKLQKINSSSAAAGPQTGRKEKWRRAGAALICLTKTERAFYRFTRNMLANERKLKLRLYPNLAFAAIFPFITLSGFLRSGKSFSEVMQQLAGSRYYFALYITATLLMVTVKMLSTSEKYRGAWIYRALPLASPAPVLKGALKGFIVKFIVPIYLFDSIIFILIGGLKIIPDVILIFLNLLLAVLFLLKMTAKELPFSRDFETTADGNRVGMVFLSMAVCGGLAAVHAFAQNLAFGVIFNMIGSLVLIAVLWHLDFKITWREILYE